MSSLNPVTELVQEKTGGSRPCNICGTTEFSLVSELDREKKYLRTVICQGCGLVFTEDNRIADMKQFYTKEYRGKGKKPALKHILRHGNNALERYARIKKHLQPGQKVFDIGSGGGEFVYLLASKGFQAKGIEPHERFANYCKESLGIDIVVDFLEGYATTTDDQFDMVTIFHVLEHKEDPADTLGIIAKLLKPGGLCVIEVPNISSYSISPKNLFHIDHLFNFNQVTLTQLGKKHGFTLVDTVFSRIQGNITVVLKKSGTPESGSLRAPENYERLYKKLSSHTMFRHYCTHVPYVRLFAKGWRYLNERQFALQFHDGRKMLDSLYQNA